MSGIFSDTFYIFDFKVYLEQVYKKAIILKHEKIKEAQKLVGNVSEDDLRNVDWYVHNDVGIFIPSIGFCEYAVLNQHTHPSYSFIIFFSSEEQKMVKTKIKVRPTYYLTTALSPEIPHEEEGEQFTRYMALFISKELYESQYLIYKNNLPENYNWEQFLVGHEIMFYTKKFILECEKNNVGSKVLLDSLSVIITHYILQSILSIDDSSQNTINKIEIFEAIEFMHRNFDRKILIGELAQFSNMSEANFFRIFKKETKMTPLEYLVMIRIEKAKKFLRNGDKKITEVAMLCGFNSNSHFSSCFIRATGLTPSDYQNSFVI